jgi:hypothetical protein
MKIYGEDILLASHNCHTGSLLPFWPDKRGVSGRFGGYNHTTTRDLTQQHNAFVMHLPGNAKHALTFAYEHLPIIFTPVVSLQWLTFSRFERLMDGNYQTVSSAPPNCYGYIPWACRAGFAW